MALRKRLYEGHTLKTEPESPEQCCVNPLGFIPIPERIVYDSSEVNP